MPTVEEWFLRLHIAAGVVALLMGAVALGASKGSWRHRQAGKTFVAAMAVVVGTVFLLLGIEPAADRAFLALVAVLSGYLVFSGYRAVPRHRPPDGPGGLDVGATGTVVIACLALGGWGLVRLVGGEPFGVVLAVFGAIGLGFGARDLRAIGSGDRPDEWQVSHLQRMIGAYIATVTAVSAVNLTAALGAVAWLWPTAVFVPLIAHWSNKYDETG